MQRLLFIIFVLAFASNLLAQGTGATRLPLEEPALTANPTSAEQLFTEASEYADKKFAEMQKKTPAPRQTDFEQVLLEQRQIASRYAVEVATRENLTAEDNYFLGLLQNLSANFDGAILSFQKFLASDKPDAEKAQRARFLLVAIYALRKDMVGAESALSGYLKSSPIKAWDRSDLESMLARSYFGKNELERAAFHASEAYSAIKAYFDEPATRPAEIYKVYQMATLLFSIQKEQGNLKQAVSTMESLQKIGAYHDSSDIYFSATDKIITLLIEAGQRPEAMAQFEKAKGSIDKLFRTPGVVTEVNRLLRKRERHYAIMSTKAPDLTIDNSFTGDTVKTVNLSDLQGKVILIDFWATWCGPCIGALPRLSRWQKEHEAEGLEIIGLTRYYGMSYGLPADEPGELKFVKNFVKSQRLPYEIAVAKDGANHAFYNANTLPTVVLIDRKGIIRYITTGSSSTRDDETEKMLEKLLAEK
jgi:thiol-disulfide isomerase/thioredoxin